MLPWRVLERSSDTIAADGATWWRRLPANVLTGAAITLAFSPVALAIASALSLRDVYILFLIPVIFSATRLGLAGGIASSLCATAVSAYLFYAPIYSLAVLSYQDVLSLGVFVTVAVITSHLSSLARSSAAAAATNMRDLELLYAFSRSVISANGPDDIYAAVQQHASSLVGGPVSVLRADRLSASRIPIPEPVRRAIATLSRGAPAAKAPNASLLVTDPDGAGPWLLRPFTEKPLATGFLLVDLAAPAASADLPQVRTRIEALLDDAVSMLERLDLATTVTEAELRRQGTALREAVIGSASHGLRTPLAAIMGSASILAGSPAVKDDPRLSQLAGIVVAEAGRLNGDIQRMLDAATLSASGVRPSLAWIEASDLVNAAVDARQREFAGHVLLLDHATDLPFVHVDPALAREALGLILDNAARYSPPGSTIRVTTRSGTEDETVTVTVEDEGVGIDEADPAELLEKFYRGRRTREGTRGSGLGLWIAAAFLAACDGRIELARRDDNAGTRVTVQLHAGAAPGNVLEPEPHGDD